MRTQSIQIRSSVGKKCLVSSPIVIEIINLQADFCK